MQAFHKVTVNGRTFTTGNDLYEFENMAHAGWVKIQSSGQENLYFTFKDDTGKERNGYCKCL